MGFANLILGFILSGSRAENPTFILFMYLILVVIFFMELVTIKNNGIH
ncbi:MAG: hypothetical protein ACTSVZ_00785 [Promethearchaeota archaeon]